MDMKNINYKIKGSKIVALFLLLAFACSKDEVGTLSLSRQFSPTKFTITNAETQSTVTWSASLFTTSGQVSYTVEVDSTTDFPNPAVTTTTTDLTVVITNTQIPIKKNYYARVKALGQGNTGDSYWFVSPSFKILGEQFLNPVTPDNVIDESVRLTWRASPDLTKIVITPAKGAPIVVNLTATDLAATLKQVDNLTPGTTYTAEIFAGTLSKGTQTFTTVAALSGNVVDLRGISVTLRPHILTDTLPTIPSGSTVLLKRGSSYFLAAAYKFDRSVSIQSGLDFGTNLAIIRVNGFNFDFVASSNIDSIVFRTLTVKGNISAYAAGGMGYLFNGNSSATVNKIRLDNCTLKVLRGVLRGQAGAPGVQVTNYYVNNCVMDSIREYGIATTSGGCVFKNVTITNSTLYRGRKLITFGVAGSQTITINNCTFSEVPAGVGTAAASSANYLIDLGGTGATFTSTVKISNSIFGWPWNPEPSTTTPGTIINGIRAAPATVSGVAVSNTYNTSDFTFTASPINGFTSYSGTTLALFTDPNNGNFKIKDSNFIGKGSSGDPRWR
jgi:hypothetical protein